MHTAHLVVVVERDPTAKPLFERLLEKCRFVELGKHLGDCRPCNLARNAEGLQLLDDASAAAAAEADFRPRAGQRRTAVVESPLGAQAAHGIIDFI
jgi:hypothetical protein